jgi:signal transduction histidine kinase
LVEVADAERKRIQRNLHDGAQQRITSVLLCLGPLRAQTDEPVELLDSAIDELAAGLDEIRTLANGLHPSLLSERGLAAAVEALALRAPIAIEVDALPEERLPEPVEAAGYYVVAEALANVQKHAGARCVVVSVTAEKDALDVRGADDGVGGADADGHGLRGLADRVEALGGRLAVESPRAGGTVLRAAIPRGQQWWFARGIRVAGGRDGSRRRSPWRLGAHPDTGRRSDEPEAQQADTRRPRAPRSHGAP